MVLEPSVKVSGVASKKCAFKNLGWVFTTGVTVRFAGCEYASALSVENSCAQ